MPAAEMSKAEIKAVFDEEMPPFFASVLRGLGVSEEIFVGLGTTPVTLEELGRMSRMEYKTIPIPFSDHPDRQGVRIVTRSNVYTLRTVQHDDWFVFLCRIEGAGPIIDMKIRIEQLVALIGDLPAETQRLITWRRAMAVAKQLSAAS